MNFSLDGEDLGNGGGSDLPESNAATSDAPPVDPVLAATNDLPEKDENDDEVKEGDVPANADGITG